MSTKSILLSSGYSVGQIGLGLLMHPYQTLQFVVQEKVFVWMALFPSVVLASLIVMWRWPTLPLLETVFECRPSYPFICDAVVFLARWITLFCAYWQILLLYLFVRFAHVFRKE
jgi:hypothetical protein